jgi:phosphatidylinositol dimannoside acyltransferase
MEQLMNSPAGVTLASLLGRTTPPRLGYAIARLAATWVASRRNSKPVQAARANQWVVNGENATPEALDQAVRAVFQNAARSIYELYHYAGNLQAVGKIFRLDPSAQVFANRPTFDQRGLVVVGLHLNGFDLGLQWICSGEVKPLVLTIPNPQGGRQLEFEMRKKTGMNLIPTSVMGLRQALDYLALGGLVASGLDRPQGTEARHKPLFFGRPANLPTHYIYLALKARVPVMVTASRREADNTYTIFASPPIEMDPYSDRTAALLRNAEKVLAVAENFIRQQPRQWVITLPVWPETVNQVPA